MKVRNLLEYRDHASKERVMEDLRENCGKILNQMYKTLYTDNRPKLLYRGINRTGDIDLISVRKDRRPLDSTHQVHKLLDDFFFNVFGIRGRSGTAFATFDAGKATVFGNPHVILPVGDFKILYSPKLDDLEHLDNVVMEEVYSLVQHGHVEQGYKLLLDEYDFRVTDDINDVDVSHAAPELMVACDMYYALSLDYFEELFDVELW